MIERIAVLGAGSWGTALALHFSRLGPRVRLWGYDPAEVRELSQRRENVTFLPGFPLPPVIEVTGDVASALAGADLVVLVAPSHGVRGVLESARSSFPAKAPLLIATKGIEVGSLMLMTQVAVDVLGLGQDRLAVLSGPSFALEVARQHPTAVVVASEDEPLAVSLQTALSSDSLRLYTNADTTGVQVCGALKNVMAMAAGVLTGMGLGANSVAALLTRGLAEMQRLGAAMGASPMTFAGLAGVGDLILTATGDLSRNRRFGIELGRGRAPAEILAETKMVVEGVRTADAAWSLASRAGIEMPIVEQVRRVLYDGVSPAAAIADLMARRLRSEY